MLPNLIYKRIAVAEPQDISPRAAAPAHPWDRCARRVAGVARWAALLGVLLLLGATLWATGRERHLAVDDAYISFRYARNLYDGHGLRWNADSAPCEGYSNLLQILFVAAGFAASLEPDTASWLANGLAMLLGAVLLLRTACVERPWSALALLPVTVLLASEDLVTHASRGLETVAFGALAAALAWAVHRSAMASARRRWGAIAGVLATLVVLGRPDGALFVGLGGMVLAWESIRARRSGMSARGAWTALAVGASGIGAYLLWKLAYFGHLLPNPYYMKATAPGMPGWPHVVAFLCDHGLDLGLFAAATGCAIAGFCGWGRRPRLLPVWLLVTVLAWLGYCASIVHEIGFAHRFAWPILPVCAYGATVVFARCHGHVHGARWQRWLQIGAALLVLALALPRLQALVPRFAAPVAEDTVGAAFARIGKALGAFGLGWQLQLYCSHAGITPYHAGAHHIDPAGLVDDGFCTRTAEAVRAHYQATIRPDVILSHLPPLSVGATRVDDDPRLLASTYFRTWCLGIPDDLDEAVRLLALRATTEHRKRFLTDQMVFLRDFCTCVGEMNNGCRRHRLFVYVLNLSPHRERLVRHLGGAVDIPAAAVDWNDWPTK